MLVRHLQLQCLRGNVPAGESDPLGPGGLTSLTAGLHVSTCSAIPSLGSTATAGARRGVADTPLALLL